jgi:Tfp pilus assembly protein PilX
LKERVMRQGSRFSAPRRQRGATLVVALLVLVLIMMIGITAVSTSDTQFKLAGNVQFEDSALNNAETAVAEAERWLSTGTNFSTAAFTAVDPATDPDPGPDAGTPQLLPRTTVDSVRAARVDRPFSMTWADTNSLAVGGNDVQRYYIELMSINNKLQGSSQRVGARSSSGCNQVNTYLITGRGVSARGATKFVQSYYSVLSCT